MRNYRKFVKETMQHPNEASEYLKASLDEYEKDGNIEAFLMAIRTVAGAQGGITELARNTDLNRQSLYRTLSKNGNPRLITLDIILNSLGFKLTIEPKISLMNSTFH